MQKYFIVSNKKSNDTPAFCVCFCLFECLVVKVMWLYSGESNVVVYIVMKVMWLYSGESNVVV